MNDATTLLALGMGVAFLVGLGLQLRDMARDHLTWAIITGLFRGVIYAAACGMVLFVLLVLGDALGLT